MIDLVLLRTVALKGRVPLDDVVATTGLGRDELSACAEQAVTAGLLKEVNGNLRVTPEGRERLEGLLAEERERIDRDQMRQVYDEFCVINAEAKEVFTSWQVRPDGSPNDHADAAYDSAVLDRLSALHRRVLPLVDRAAFLVPRAARFADRLVAAQQKYSSGDHAYVTRPIIDSYHTVWFELHEDLISWCGLTREAEAAAGRAH